MPRLETEMSQRFPELAAQITEHHDLPYVIMAELGRWLETVPESAVPAALERVRSFVAWCEQQARSDDPAQDIFTIWSSASTKSYWNQPLSGGSYRSFSRAKISSWIRGIGRAGSEKKIMRGRWSKSPAPPNHAMERTSGSSGSSFSMKLNLPPAAMRYPASRRSCCSR
jgi:hypothetical protein